MLINDFIFIAFCTTCVADHIGCLHSHTIHQSPVIATSSNMSQNNWRATTKRCQIDYF